ncbi:MAG TPA: helix-turn-helix domain-containing protein [Nocardioides sp.]
MVTASLRQQVAAEIRAEMARQRKTGVDLARLLQCSQQSASRRLNGGLGLDLDELPVIADWLGVPLVNLLAASQKDAA